MTDFTLLECGNFGFSKFARLDYFNIIGGIKIGACWQKACNGGDIWPVPRAIFHIFFAHWLFRNVHDVIVAEKPSYKWHPDALATVFVLLRIVVHVCNRMSSKGIGIPDLVVLISIPMTGIVIWQAQKAINTACGQPDGESNSRLTALNYLWAGLGFVIICMAVIGLMLPDSQ